MERIEFEKILFNSAVCIMACDGEIHDSEIQELELIAVHSPYFRNIDYKSELDFLIHEFQNKAKKVFSTFFSLLENSDLNPVQKLQVIEVMMRIMHADNRIEKNEIRFIQIAKFYLGIPNEILKKRFGNVKYLIGEYDSTQEKTKKMNIIDDFPLPDFGSLSISSNEESNIISNIRKQLSKSQDNEIIES